MLEKTSYLMPMLLEEDKVIKNIFECQMHA